MRELQNWSETRISLYSPKKVQLSLGAIGIGYKQLPQRYLREYKLRHSKSAAAKRSSSVVARVCQSGLKPIPFHVLDLAFDWR